jgi:NAD(P)-dependent dehydrogenase (short-subunit alcohol dehydrogenase family)
MARMDGRVALVTGASSGIGRAAALALAQEGAAVVLVALPGAELDAVARDCRERGVNAVAVAADVKRPSDVEAAFARAEELGPVDAVFNNAGISMVVAITETTDEQWERLVRTNLTGSFYVMRAAARVMVPRGRGAIVNTASELALIGEAGYAAYTATKGGILSMTRALAAELAPHGVRVNAVCPGATDTPLLRAEYQTAPDPAEAKREGEQSIALGRLARAEEIAGVVAFLLSDDAAYVTGSHYVVDGGRTSCIATGSLTPRQRAAVPS